MARPESLRLAAPGEGGTVAGRVVERRFTGVVTYATVRLELSGEPEVEVLVAGGDGAAGEGDAVGIAPGSTGPRPRIFASTPPADRPSDRTVTEDRR